ncbi:MAG TPA: MFS transporter [Methylomirabilota bacterium]|nr:MFS transporter [Methylomirabilota bacterium]
MPPILALTPFVRATVTNFFFGCGVNGFVLLPLYIQQLGGTEIEIGLVMGLYSAVGIVCQTLIGPWIDVIGRRPFMLAGVALALLAALLATLPGGVPLLALVRALQGVGFSMFFVASFSYVVDLTPPARRGWALGIYGVSGFVATAFAPLLGEWIIRTAGFRALFALSATMAAVTGSLVWPLREAAHDRALPLRLAPGAVRAAMEDLLHLHMLVTTFFGLGSGTIFAFLPTFAEDLGVRTLSLFYTAYALAAIAVRVTGGRLIDTRGRRAVIVPSMFVQALSTALLAAVGLLVLRTSATPVLPSLFVAGLLSGGAHGFLYPGLAALVTDTTPPERRAAVVGLFSAMFLTGQAAGAFAFGYVAHALGYGAMWAALTLLLALGGVLSMRLSR